MHRGKRYRMPVDAFALVRGAERPVSSKQEAEKLWEPKFIGEIVAGKDPRKAPAPPVPEGTTVADFLDQYCERYVVAESLRSVASIRSRLDSLKDALGTLSVGALERTETIEDFKHEYGKTRSIAAVKPNARHSSTCHQLGTRAHSGDLHCFALPPVWRQDQDEGRDQARSPDRAGRRAEAVGSGRQAQLCRARLRWPRCAIGLSARSKPPAGSARC